MDVSKDVLKSTCRSPRPVRANKVSHVVQPAHTPPLSSPFLDALASQQLGPVTN